MKGTPTAVAEGVATDVGSGAVQFAVAESGAALWAPGGLLASYRIVWVDRHGTESPVDVPAAPYQELALSPDGTRLALVGGPGGVSDLWVADLERGVLSRLSSGEFVRAPAWTPDGSRVAYLVLPPGEVTTVGRIDWRLADGSRPAETLVPDGALGPSDFTADGRTLIFNYGSRATTFDIQALPLDGSGPARSLLQGSSGIEGRVSPDGRWLAYVSNESGQDSMFSALAGPAAR